MLSILWDEILEYMNPTEIFFLSLTNNSMNRMTNEIIRIKGKKGMKISIEYCSKNISLIKYVFGKSNINRIIKYYRKLINCVAGESSLECLKFVYENRFEYEKKYGKLSDQPWIGFSLICAASMGNLENLKFLNDNVYHYYITVCEYAAINGKLECLKYLYENGCPYNESKLYNCAARHLECLKYLHNMGLKPNERTYICVLDSSSNINNRLEIIKFLYINGCPWDENVTKKAAELGSLDCLRYLCENGCPYNKEAMDHAAFWGHLNCIKYLHSIGCPWDKKTSNLATNNIDCLRYIHEKGCPLGDDICSYALENGNLECLKYVRSRGAKWPPILKTTNLECLKYAHKNNCKWVKETLKNIIVCDKIECLKYAHENGCPWDEKTIEYAARYGSLKCLKYTFENGCPKNDNLFEIAASNGDFECLKYLFENGYKWSEKTFKHIVENPNLSLKAIKYAYKNNCPWGNDVCFEASDKSLEYLIYLRENGCPWDMRICEYAYKNKLMSHIKNYVRKYGCDCEWKEKMNKQLTSCCDFNILITLE